MKNNTNGLIEMIVDYSIREHECRYGPALAAAISIVGASAGNAAALRKKTRANAFTLSFCSQEEQCDVANAIAAICNSIVPLPKQEEEVSGVKVLTSFGRKMKSNSSSAAYYARDVHLDYDAYSSHPNSRNVSIAAMADPDIFQAGRIPSFTEGLANRFVLIESVIAEHINTNASLGEIRDALNKLIHASESFVFDVDKVTEKSLLEIKDQDRASGVRRRENTIKLSMIKALSRFAVSDHRCKIEPGDMVWASSIVDRSIGRIHDITGF